MKDTVIQCCYTNATHEVGNKNVSGWQAVAVSPDVPADAYQNAISYMNVHSSMKGIARNADGSDVNLLELYGDGKYLYYIRTKYGLLDHSGRPNLFSHTYILPWSMEGMSYDPNIYLTISASNFKDNENAALQISDTFQRDNPMNVLAEMRNIQLSPHDLAHIVRCIYVQMTDKTVHEPLYIQFDGNEREMMGIIFCIYSLLPHYLIRRFSISFDNGEDNRSLNVILSKEAVNHKLYMNPYSGENNIIGERQAKKLKHLGYVDFPAFNIERFDPQIYMRNLDEIVKWLGDADMSDEYGYRMAHLKHSGELDAAFDANVICEYISDGLRARKCQSAGMDKLLSAVVEKGIAAGTQVSEETEYELTLRAYQHNSADLINAMEKYTTSLLGKMTVDQAADRLSRMDEKIRERYISYYSFVDREKGDPILDNYYVDHYAIFEQMSPQELDTVIDKIGDFEGKPDTKEKIYRTIISLYKKKQENGGDMEAVKSYFADMVEKLEDDMFDERFKTDMSNIRSE